MNGSEAFWDVDGFWAMAGVLALFAALATLLICTGPDETPYDEGPDVDAADLAVKTEWGFSLTEWNALGDQDRAYYRQHVTQAKPGTRP